MKNMFVLTLCLIFMAGTGWAGILPDKFGGDEETLYLKDDNSELTFTPQSQAYVWANPEEIIRVVAGEDGWSKPPVRIEINNAYIEREYTEDGKTIIEFKETN